MAAIAVSAHVVGIANQVAALASGTLSQAIPREIVCSEALLDYPKAAKNSLLSLKSNLKA